VFQRLNGRRGGVDIADNKVTSSGSSYCSVGAPAALSTSGVSGLNVDQLSVLETTQVGAFSATQIGAISTSVLSAMSGDKLAALTSTQASGLTSSQVLQASCVRECEPRSTPLCISSERNL
jgi:hypothetical protein